ncbi:MAG: hypothetical protein Q4B99_02155 [Clostridia bacterium]|nr:hypothetical protein [Clostridia bacterium]
MSRKKLFVVLLACVLIAGIIVAGVTLAQNAGGEDSGYNTRKLVEEERAPELFDCDNITSATLDAAEKKAAP